MLKLCGLQLLEFSVHMCCPAQSECKQNSVLVGLLMFHSNSIYQNPRTSPGKSRPMLVYRNKVSQTRQIYQAKLNLQHKRVHGARKVQISQGTIQVKAQCQFKARQESQRPRNTQLGNECIVPSVISICLLC